MKKVLIWGIGRNYQANKNIIRNDIEIIGFVDNNSTVQGTVVDGKKVYSPAEIGVLNFDFLFIFCQKYPDVRKQIMKMDISRDIVVYDISQIEMLCDLPPAIYYNYFDISDDGKERLLLFSPALSSTGAQNILLYFTSLVSDRYHITVVSKSDGIVRERLVQLGAAVVITGDFRLENEAINYEIAKADLILVNTIWLGYLVDNLRAIDKKVIWWLHESAMLSYIDCACIKRCLLADNIFTYAVSRIVVDYIESECGMPNSIKLFPIGLPEYPIVESRQERNKVRFAIISGIAYIKGQDVYIKAIAEIPEAKRKEAEFWVVGAGHLDQDTQNIAAGIPEIVIKGEIDNKEMPIVYSQLDAVVCCSREESMSVTVIEGFMNGKNTIVSDRAGVADYISDGINGFVVKSEDISGFAEKMTWIIDHRNESFQMGKRSRIIYEENFSEKVFQTSIDRVLGEVLRG